MKIQNIKTRLLIKKLNIENVPLTSSTDWYFSETFNDAWLFTFHFCHRPVLIFKCCLSMDMCELSGLVDYFQYPPFSGKISLIFCNLRSANLINKLDWRFLSVQNFLQVCYPISSIYEAISMNSSLKILFTGNSWKNLEAAFQNW